MIAHVPEGRQSSGPNLNANPKAREQQNTEHPFLYYSSTQ
jgi:hypothetical protein